MLAGNHELSACDVFSLLCFYQADERNGRTHETWSGTLAPLMIDHGIADAIPAPAAAAPAPMSSPLRAPQFAGASRATLSRSY